MVDAGKYTPSNHHSSSSIVESLSLYRSLVVLWLLPLPYDVNTRNDITNCVGYNQAPSRIGGRGVGELGLLF